MLSPLLDLGSYQEVVFQENPEGTKPIWRVNFEVRQEKFNKKRFPENLLSIILINPYQNRHR